MYSPDNWVILKVDVDIDKLHYRILAGWSGGYLDGDSWRMNSGITKIEEEDDYYLFTGETGSVYKCFKGSEILRMNNAHIYENLKNQHQEKIELIRYEDFIKEFKNVKQSGSVPVV